MSRQIGRLLTAGISLSLLGAGFPAAVGGTSVEQQVGPAEAAATSAPPWTLRQSGFHLDTVATGFQLPVNIAFKPNAGAGPTDPYFYVAELYGNIKVVTRNGSVSDYIHGVLNYQPSGNFSNGTGEQGLAGIVVEPTTGDIFASMLYVAANGALYAKVVRYRSNTAGTVAASSSTILDIHEQMSYSHQISNLTIGPDGKLYVHVGDAFVTSTAQDLTSFRGKILRVNLDGTAPTDNPFYDASDGITAKDDIFAYGFRNPFGGDWRPADGKQYEVENGPSVDRIAQLVRGRNYGWNGTDASMYTYAAYNWSPEVAPVNIAFVDPAISGGSGFPAAKMGHAFVSESGDTYATGAQAYGKKISEFVFDASGGVVDDSVLIEYTGTGKGTAVALAAGPDGLYFSDFFKDQNYSSAIDPGANIFRIAADTTPPTDTSAPNETAPYSSLYSTTSMTSSAVPVRTSWSATDSSGIGSYWLERQDNGGEWVYESLPSVLTTSIVQALSFNSTYRYVVKATDGVGNTTDWVYGRTFKPLLTEQTSSAIGYSGTWYSVSATSASGGSLKYTISSGASASYTFTGSNIAWVSYRGPSQGSAQVYIDGALRATVSLYASSYSLKQIVFAYNWAANGTHTIKIVNLATSGHPRIDLDAFLRLYQT